MKLVSFLYQEAEDVGAVSGEEIIPIPEFSSMEELIRKGIPGELSQDFDWRCKAAFTDPKTFAGYHLPRDELC